MNESCVAPGRGEQAWGRAVSISEGPGWGWGHSGGQGGRKAAWLTPPTPPHPVSGNWLFSEPETLNPDPPDLAQVAVALLRGPPTPAGWLWSRAPALGCGYDAVCGGVFRGIQLPTAPARSDSKESQPPSSHGRVSDRAVPAAESAVPSPFWADACSSFRPGSRSPPRGSAGFPDSQKGGMPPSAGTHGRAREPPGGAGCLGSAY